MRKKIILILAPFILGVLLISCRPSSRFIKPESEAPIDSTLYFEQVDISDPFLDSLDQEQDERITLSKTYIPPAQPQPEISHFKEVEGFRVQIFAGLDSINALSISYQAKDLTSDSIHFFKEKGLYKIQVGDYQFRSDADELKTTFRQNGFPGAWVVQRSVMIPLAPDQSAAPIEQGEIIQHDTVGVKGRYKIQVLATNSEVKAQMTVLDLKENNKYQAFFEKSGDLYKVFVGYFKIEQKAREVLQEIRTIGYPDAWLVY
jgi:hypothetical protein